MHCECGCKLLLNDSMRGKVGGGPGIGSTITVETANVHDTNSEASIIESQMLLVQKDDSLLSFS